MEFNRQLDEYMRRLDANYTELASVSGMSTSALSRYRSGQREPDYDSAALDKLASGLATLARRRGKELDEGEVRAALGQAVKNHLHVEYGTYLYNLNSLLQSLNIRGNELAKALNYDPSHISKILAGHRRPRDFGLFTANVASYAARRCTTDAERSASAALLGCAPSAVSDERTLRKRIADWLGENDALAAEDPLTDFLDKMDSFDMNKFINSIHFDAIRIPSIPFHLPTAKNYTGPQGMKDAELDFERATIFSRSMEDCFLYTDMPFDELTNDTTFVKKWMFGRAAMLKKGLRLQIIHDVDRPFREMLLGLEFSIPIYMTGHISPYYFPEPQSRIFHHMLYVSGSAALEGSGVADDRDGIRFTMYRAKEDVAHCRVRANQLMSRALPLMDIYTDDRAEVYAAASDELWRQGDRRTVHSSLPLYTLPEELLLSILDRSGVSSADAERILAFRARQLSLAEELLSGGGAISLTVPDLSPEQFARSPLQLALSELFFPTDVPYTYQEYQAHLAHTRAFAAAHDGMTLEADAYPTFRNISYTVIGEQCVVVSKNKSPTIHFVIHHEKMVEAFLGFIPPLREDLPQPTP